MNIKIKMAAIIVLQFLVVIGYAQERKLNKANQKYDQLAFVDATEVYLNVAQSGYKSEELFKKLGNSYYFNANYEEASKWYGELFAFIPSVTEPSYYLRYSQSLKAIGRDSESEEWFDKYAKKVGLSGKTHKNAKDYLAIIEANSGRYEIKPLAINTEGVDFGTAFFEDKIVFASTRDSASIFKRRSAWDGLSFLELYEAKVDEEGTLGEPTKLKGDINTKMHESSAVFTKDGKIMYFTRNNITPKTKRSKDDVQHLKIYRAHLINGEWTNVEDLSINGDNYSTAHPALSVDERVLYFASDMPQSLGQTDLFMVSINTDGSLGQVTNLGEKINTEGRESFPYITEEDELYFSSDGHYGLGGYDVFYSKINDNKTFGDLINVGEPINSPFDDVAFVIRKHKGYISSNRLGGSGNDDIYSFVETKDIKELLKSKIYGIVTDETTKEPLANATITILDESNNELVQLQTDARGYYETQVDYSKAYILKAKKDGYSSDDAYAIKEIKEREHNFELEKVKTEVSEGDDVADLLNIIIHFDLDKSFIRSDAQTELEKLVVFMKENPHVKVDIQSHTDSRADDAYNVALSERRAASTLNYLVQRGISKDRLTAKGFGETQLVNGCVNGVKCSDDEHEKNRRSEFIVRK